MSRAVARIDKVTRGVVGTYGSVAGASRASGASKHLISRQCRDWGIGDGRSYYRYLDEFDPNEELNTKAQKRGLPIRILDTLDGSFASYHSAKEACASLGVTKKTVSRMLHGESGRYIARYLARPFDREEQDAEMSEYAESHPMKRAPRWKFGGIPVVGADKVTRKVEVRYSDIYEALAETGLLYETLVSACTLHSISKERLYWRFESDFDPDEDMAQRQNAPIVAYSPKRDAFAYFHSVREASETLHYSLQYVRAAVRNGYKVGTEMMVLEWAAPPSRAAEQKERMKEKTR